MIPTTKAVWLGFFLTLLIVPGTLAAQVFPQTDSQKTGTARDTALQVSLHGRSMRIECALPAGVSAVEVRLLSRVNDTIFEYSDVSPYAPRDKNSQTGAVFDPEWQKIQERDRASNRELRFPVVDVAIGPEMEAVLEFDVKGPGQYSFNGNFYPGMLPIAEEIRIPAERVEYWENAVLLDPKSNAIRRFYVAARPKLADSKASLAIETLRADWNGTVSIHDATTGKLLASAEVSGEVDTPRVSTGQGVTRQRMLESLSWATRYLLDCENTNPRSPTSGGHFLLYDLAARTRLRSDWPWSWGPSALMLMNVSEIRGIDVGLTPEQLIKAATDLGAATLRQQILDRSHPAYGFIRATNEPGTLRESGFDNRATPADTLFLVGWGWIPLYHATHDRRFLEAAEKVADATARLMDASGQKMIPQAFDLKAMKWDDRMFFETSMGMRGLAALYLETGDERHRRTMVRFVDMLLATFEREDGLWNATYYRKTDSTSSSNFFTKSFGYCVDGLLVAHQAAPDRGYLQRAKTIARHVLDGQASDGSWSVRLDRDAKEVGVDDKGTALWAYLFMRMYKETKDPEYLAAGTKAIEWCMDHQYFGDDPIARGGIVGRSWPSGIIYRHWFDMITTYTVSFFGCALTEALGLDKWKAESE